jgi:hypothetical protein
MRLPNELDRAICMQNNVMVAYVLSLLERHRIDIPNHVVDEIFYSIAHFELGDDGQFFTQKIAQSIPKNTYELSQKSGKVNVLVKPHLVTDNGSLPIHSHSDENKTQTNNQNNQQQSHNDNNDNHADESHEKPNIHVQTEDSFVI